MLMVMVLLMALNCCHGTVIGSDGYFILDNNNNGITDHLDPNDQSACQGDADGDGIDDLTDLDDNDGIYDAYEGDDTVDTDGDGIPDYLDLILMVMAVLMLLKQDLQILM